MAYDGPLPLVAKAGGTGVATLTSGQLVVGAGTSPVTAQAFGTASAASTIVQRDASQNIYSNNTFTKSTNTVSATGTTTLTAASSPSQTLTGTQPQTYQLPDATTLTIGAEYKFNNNTSNSVLTIKDGGGSTIFTVPFGGRAVVLLIVNVTTAGSWDAQFEMPANASYGTAGLTVTGNINSSALTASLPVFTDASKNLTSTGVVGEVHGGTNQATYTTGDTLYASAANTLSKLAIGTAGQVMTVAGGVPSWAASGGGGGGVKGFASTVSTTATSTGTILVITTTVPTTSNTTSLTSVTYTPTSATNMLRFDFCCPFSTALDHNVGFFLFQGTTLLASYPITATSGGRGNTASFMYVMPSGTTSSTTYSVYYAGTVSPPSYILTDVGTPFYGATGSTSYIFSVTEYA